MTINPETARHVEALLEFYLESGVDCLVGDHSIDWVARSLEIAAAQRQARDAQKPAMPGPRSAVLQSGPASAGFQHPGSSGAKPVPQPGQAASGLGGMSAPERTHAGIPAAPVGAGFPAVPNAQTIQAARDLASSARNLNDLKAALASFEGCNLRLTAKSLVFSDGTPEARVMIVGEAPGRDDDHDGRPFVGPAGQLLERMLAAIGLDRNSVYMANVLPWRPPGGRTATPQETDVCKPFIQRQIELASPEVLVFLGAATAKTLIGSTDGIRRLRGRWMTYSAGGRDIPVIVSYHPDYLRMNPGEKRFSWQDLQSIRARLQEKI